MVKSSLISLFTRFFIKMIISATARHYIGNEATLEEFKGGNGIIDRTVNSLGKEARNLNKRGYNVKHKLRVDYDSRFGQDNFLEVKKLGEEIRKEGIGFNLQVGMGPGYSFLEGLLFRDCDVSIVYGADQIHINKNLDCFAEVCFRLNTENKVLGGAARPNKVLLSDVPEGDLMRQIHETYYTLAAGGYEGRKIDNPFNFDTSNGSSLYIGVNSEGGFGDLTSGFAAINHNSTRAQIVCQNLVNIANNSNPNNFCSEYGIFINEGIKNIVMIYIDFSENMFYRDKGKLSEKDIKQEIKKREKFIKSHTYELGKIPYIKDKLVKILRDNKIIEIIERNIVGYELKNSKRFINRVNVLMIEGLEGKL